MLWPSWVKSPEEVVVHGVVEVGLSNSGTMFNYILWGIAKEGFCMKDLCLGCCPGNLVLQVVLCWGGGGGVTVCHHYILVLELF